MAAQAGLHTIMHTHVCAHLDFEIKRLVHALVDLHQRHIKGFRDLIPSRLLRISIFDQVLKGHRGGSGVKRAVTKV